MQFRTHLIISALIISLLAAPSLGILFAQETVVVETPKAPAGPSAEELARQRLQQQIEAKNKDLDGLNRQLEETKRKLESAQSNRSKLQKELGTIQSSISSLTYSIRADQVQVEKLGLEIEQLSLDLEEIGDQMDAKQEAIEAVLRQMQKGDKETVLLTFLRSKTLTDTVEAAEALRGLQARLSSDVGNLRLLREKFNDRLTQTSDKKDQVAARARNLQNRKVIIEDQKQEQQKVIAQTKNQESVYARQVAELQKQQKQIASEIEEIDAVLRGKINRDNLPKAGNGILARPIEGGTLTQDYGVTSFSLGAYRSGRHNGVDFKAAVGTPILAAEDGVVAASGNQDAYCPRGAYGRFIVVNHDNNLTSMYAHLSRSVVATGERVKRGQVIGYSGQTGYATGPHLHFTVYARPTFYMGPSKTCGPMPFGGDLNPMSYL